MTLGAAIDTLSRDLSRERAHAGAVAARRLRISEDASTPSLDHSSRESLVWERAALEAEETRAEGIASDLGFQIEALQGRLAAQNEQLGLEMNDATGELEGALAALRHMTGELVRTIEEAAAAVGK